MVVYRSTFSLIACRDSDSDLKVAFSSDCDTLNKHCALAPGRYITWNLDAYTAAKTLLQMTGSETTTASEENISNIMNGIFHYNAHLWCGSKAARIPFMHEANRAFALHCDSYDSKKAKLILQMFGPLQQYAMYAFEPRYPMVAELYQNPSAQQCVINIIRGLQTTLCAPKEALEIPVSSELKEDNNTVAITKSTNPVLFPAPDESREQHEIPTEEEEEQ